MRELVAALRCVYKPEKTLCGTKLSSAYNVVASSVRSLERQRDTHSCIRQIRAEIPLPRGISSLESASLSPSPGDFLQREFVRQLRPSLDPFFFFPTSSRQIFRLYMTPLASNLTSLDLRSWYRLLFDLAAESKISRATQRSVYTRAKFGVRPQALCAARALCRFPRVL